jgi:hypothetical protein
MRRTRPLRSLALLALPLLLLSTPALAGGEVNLFGGEKSLDLDLGPGDSALNPLEDQTELGVLFTWAGADWPVSLAVDILFSDEDVSDSYSYYYYGYYYDVSATIEADVREINLGVRKYWGGEKFQGYVGGGPAIINVEVSLSGTITSGPITLSLSESDDDTGFGYWLNGGIVWRFNRRFHAGVDVRLSDADVEPFAEPGEDAEFDGGGTHIGAFLGFRWGEP